MRKTSIKVTEEMVRDNLPTPPTDCSYTVERVTPMVIKVWLNHLRKFDYTTDPVRCVHSYIKRDMVHAPKNKEKMRVESVCHLSELSQQSPYSVINNTHSVKSLQHL